MSGIQRMTVDLARVVKTLPTKWINTLTPIIEWIVNAIDSINERKKIDSSFKWWEINVKINKIPNLLSDWEKTTIDNVEIIDNGIWFIDDNFESFSELYSSRKIDIWGKWFWRITYLKYFKSIKVDSIYKNNKDFRNKTFEFGNKWIFWITDDEYLLWESRYETKLILKAPNENFINSLNTKSLTLARKISEHLLWFLIDEDICPKIKISIISEWKDDSIILNDYIKGVDTKIENIGSKKLLLADVDDDLEVFVFKFYYPENQKSSINLIAHNRVVSATSLDIYIPEFKEEFYDELDKKSSKWTKKENFVIKIYVKWKYLDDYVNTERTWFNFPIVAWKKWVKAISKEDIEKESIDLIKEFFPKNLNERKLKKIEKIETIVNSDFPWHKILLKEWIDEENIDKLSYNPSKEDIDIYFGKIRFNKEWKARSVVRKILSWDYGDDIDEKVIEVEKELLDLNKSELIHYVSLRKVILDLYQKFISFDSDDKYPKEEKIHNLIFPMWKNNTNLDYDKHNLWLIDESLVFSDYITSDKAIIAEDWKKTEPDMLIFRDWKEKYSPVYIIEFKRPWRKTYSDDPLKQILWYAKRLRANKEITIDWRPINVVPETPIYWYFIWDITQKVRDSIEINDVITMEAGESYYWYHKNLNVYYSIYSFDFVYKNSEKRNKVFFDKLWINLEK